MIERHYKGAHRIICVTDEYKGIKDHIQLVPTPEAARKLASLHNPQGKDFPSCYRRLWNFSEDARYVLGERILALDVDVVITGDLAPIVDRSESFVGWTDPQFKWNKVAGGIYLLRTGSHTEIWNEFDPATSPQAASAAGCKGSDQGWMSHRLYPPEGAYTRQDGVMSLKWIPAHKPLPAGVRVVQTPGSNKPWSRRAQQEHPWIREHWTM